MVGRCRTMSRRLRVAGLIVVSLVTNTFTAGCLSQTRVPHQPYTATFPADSVLPSPAPGPFTTTGRGPDVPDRRAWFGAYVGTSSVTSVARMNAVDGFQRLIGRKLAVVHTFHPWGSTFPTALDYAVAAQHQVDLVSWAGTDTRSIQSGVYDSAIEQFAEGVKTFRTPVLLRFRWEMDRPNLSATVHSAEDYVTAWKRVRQIFSTVGATNAAFVWCPTSTAFANGTAGKYYPGDDQVDWICADLYPDASMPSFSAMMTPVMTFARTHPRPVLVGEFGVKQPGDSTSAAQNASWLREVSRVVAAQPQIKSIIYFDSSTDEKPAYDYTVDTPQSTLTAFRNMVTARSLSAPVPH